VVVIFICALCTLFFGLSNAPTSLVSGHIFSPKTQHVSTFSTSFETSSPSRSHNVALATNNFCWRVVGSGEELSFNQIVGERTAERGYQNAKVILYGEYVDGVGGGVCQVSTTLYNAWIRAGLEVSHVVNHSLPSSYCELSQDATVSDYIDMILLNDSPFAVIVNGYVKDKHIVFDIYTQPTPYTFEIESSVIEYLPATAPEVEYVDSLEGLGEVQEDGENKFVVTRQEKQGYHTMAVRKKYLRGQLVGQQKIREDYYKPTRGKISVLK